MLSRYMSSDNPPWLFQPLASMTDVEPVKDVRKQPTSPTRMMMIFCFLIFIDLSLVIWFRDRIKSYGEWEEYRILAI